MKINGFVISAALLVATSTPGWARDDSEDQRTEVDEIARSEDGEPVYLFVKNNPLDTKEFLTDLNLISIAEVLEESGYGGAIARTGSLTHLSRQAKFDFATSALGKLEVKDPTRFPGEDFSLTPMNPSVKDPYGIGAVSSPYVARDYIPAGDAPNLISHAFLSFEFFTYINGWLDEQESPGGQAWSFGPLFKDHLATPPAMVVHLPLPEGGFVAIVTVDATHTAGANLSLSVNGAASEEFALSHGLHHIPVALRTEGNTAAVIRLRSPDFGIWEFRRVEVTKVE